MKSTVCWFVSVMMMLMSVDCIIVMEEDYYTRTLINESTSLYPCTGYMSFRYDQILNPSNNAVMLWSPSDLNRVSLLAGQKEAGFVDALLGTNAMFSKPGGVTFVEGYESATLVADTGNNAIRYIAHNGSVSTILRNIPIRAIQRESDQLFVLTGDSLSRVTSEPLYAHCLGAVDLGKPVTFVQAHNFTNNNTAQYQMMVNGNPLPMFQCLKTKTKQYERLNIPNYAVWFKFDGTGHGATVLIQPQRDVSVIATIQRAYKPHTDDCQHIDCVTGSAEYTTSNRIDRIPVCTKKHVKYYIVVGSYNQYRRGDFALAVQDTPLVDCSKCSCKKHAVCGDDGCGNSCGACNRTTHMCGGKTCVARNTNDQCETATPIAITTGHKVVVEFDTTLSRDLSSYLPCQRAIHHGVWYTVVGLGTIVSFTTCHKRTNIATQIAVMRYPTDCNSQVRCLTAGFRPQCTHRTDSVKALPCLGSGVVYHVFVGAFVGDNGHVALKITDTERACDAMLI